MPIIEITQYAIRTRLTNDYCHLFALNRTLGRSHLFRSLSFTHTHIPTDFYQHHQHRPELNNNRLTAIINTTIERNLNKLFYYR